MSRLIVIAAVLRVPTVSQVLTCAILYAFCEGGNAIISPMISNGETEAQNEQ